MTPDQPTSLALAPSYTAIDLVKQSWAVLRSQPWPIVRATLRAVFLPLLPMLLLHPLAFGIVALGGMLAEREAGAPPPAPPLWAVVGSTTTFVFEIVAMCALAIYAYGGLFRVLLMAVRGEAIDRGRQALDSQQIGAIFGVFFRWALRLVPVFVAGGLLAVPGALMMQGDDKTIGTVVMVVGSVVFALGYTAFGAYLAYRVLGEATALLIAVEEGLGGAEALAEAWRRADGHKLNFFVAYLVTAYGGGTLVAIVHVATCGLGFPLVIAGQLVIVAMTMIQIAMLYELQSRR
ncbi:MAG: hypothetical protein FJ102_09015 [Deltaproteobacteria bacterium]|nr:hypothetical protein [Deltaproteobacteria bacterium]